MKNTVKTIVPSLQSRPVADNVECQNLRLMTDTKGEKFLTPVGELRQIAEGDYRPLLTHHHADGSSSLFLADGNVVSVVEVDRTLTPTTSPVPLVTLSSPPTAMVSVDATTALIFTADACRYADYDGTSWSVRADLQQFPPVSIRATDTHWFSSVVADRTLSGYSRWEGHLNADDTTAVTADLLHAYTEICTSASASHYYLQPVVARYRLVNHCGTTVFRSSPVVIAPEGLQCVDAITANVTTAGGQFKNLSSYTVAALGFRLAVNVASSLADNWKTVVDRLVVEVSPQFNPIDAKGLAFTRMENATSSSGILRMMLPGADSASATVRARIASSLAALDTVLTPVANIVSPFDAAVNSPQVDIDLLYTSQPMLTSLKVSAKTAKTKAREAVLLTNAFRFGAEVAEIVGDDLILASPTAHRSIGFSPFSFVTAASPDDGTWRAYVRVRLSDGNVVVNSFAGYGPEPTVLSPLLTYPSADAVEMEIAVKGSDGVVRKDVFPLTPIVGAEMSVWLADTLSPLSLPISAVPYIVPAATLIPIAMPATIAVAKVPSPNVATAAVTVADGRIVAVTPSRRSSSSWDFARLHLYAFATSGIYTVAVHSARDALTATLIDRRSVASRSAVAIGEREVFAIAGGDLVSVSSSTVTTIEGGVSAEALGFDPHFGELWMVDSGGNVTIRTATGYYRRTLSATRIDSVGGTLFVADGTSLAVAGDEGFSVVDVAWRHRAYRSEIFVCPFPPTSPPPKINSVTWRTNADIVDARFAVDGDNGSGEAVRMLELSVSGAVDYPIVARTHFPVRLYTTFSFTGSVDTTFRFFSVGTTLSP